MDRSALVALPVALLCSARAYIGYLFTGRRCITFYAALGLLTIAALLQTDSAMQQGNLIDDSAAELSGGRGPACVSAPAGDADTVDWLYSNVRGLRQAAGELSIVTDKLQISTDRTS